MKKNEALKLKKGDTIVCAHGNAWHKSEVLGLKRDRNGNLVIEHVWIDSRGGKRIGECKYNRAQVE